LQRRAGIKKTLLTGSMHLVVASAGLIAPFLWALLWLKQPGLLLYDPITRHGIFRGGGGFQFQLNSFIQAMRISREDLFILGNSYHFQLPIAEFGGWLGLIGFGGVLFVILRAMFAKPYRLPIIGLWVVLIAGFVLPCMAGGPPGIRRCTAALVMFYALYFLCWKFLATEKSIFPRRQWTCAIILLLILPLHHLEALFGNWSAFSQPNPWGVFWFDNKKDHPEKSFDQWLEFTRNGGVLPLKVKDNQREIITSNFSSIYGALRGYRLWNHLPQVPIKGYDFKTHRIIELDHSLWDSYYFPH
jgi:hypothetical protein